MYRAIYSGYDDVWMGNGWLITNGRVQKCNASLKTMITVASQFVLVDKCTPIERKAVYLAYGPQLRAIGAIK